MVSKRKIKKNSWNYITDGGFINNKVEKTEKEVVINGCELFYRTNERGNIVYFYRMNGVYRLTVHGLIGLFSFGFN